MDFSSILDTIKQLPQKCNGMLIAYPLTFLVIGASIILCIVFACDSTKTIDNTTIIQTNTPITTTISTSNGSIATDVSGETDIPNESGTETTMTTVLQEPIFAENVDNSYFNDALFIGNSRTVGLSLFGSMPEETTFYATVGMNIYDLLTSSAQVPPEEGPEIAFTSLLSEQSFGKIYIMLGINDLGTGTSESFTEYYRDVVEQIHQMQPNAIIYVQSIINVSAERAAQGDGIDNANINEKNALLKGLENGDYVYFLDVNEVLVDENGALNAEYTSDGIHLGGGSLPLWEDYLRAHAIVKE